MKEENGATRKRTKAAKRFGRKTFVLAVISFAASLAFALFNGVMAIVSHSVWYASMAGYYFILSLTRIAIIIRSGVISSKYEGRELAKKQLSIYSWCGAVTIILEFALTAAIINIIYSPKQPHGTIMAIVVAAYTFYKIAVAIKNIVRAREYKDYAVQSLRNLAFVDAAVSMLSLTATLTATFGSAQNLQTLIISVSAGIGALIIALGLFMFIRGAILKRKLKN